MTDVKRLLEQATPLPWRKGLVRRYGIYGTHPDDSALATVRHWEPSKEPMDERAMADADLIVKAVNHLPDYEAAVDALELLIGTTFALLGGRIARPEDVEITIEEARAALRRLRGQPAA